MNKRRTSRVFIVRAAMTLLLLLLTSATAWAESVKYIDADGQEKTQDGVTIINNNTSTTFGTTNATTWYVMTGEINFTSTVSLIGDVRIILADGAQIEINAYNGVSSEDTYNGIYATGNLTIYGQKAGSGSLTINSDKITKPGNGIYAKKGGITINGGTLNISANQYGICTYKDGSSFNCDITINGGIITVTATGENGIDADGNITLGCTKGTDYIFASSYSNTVGIANSQTLIDGVNSYSGTLTSSEITKISNKILAPNLFGISNDNTGTSDKPYIINSPDGLQLLATYVNNGFVFSGKFFTLNDDIAFNSSIENNFTPIGGKFSNNYYAFCGSFDGGNHSISGINIDIDENSYAGIFGYLESKASISNVILVNASIRGKEFIGGIAGDNDGGNISNCLVANTVIKNSITGNRYIGAITGFNSGTLDHNYYGNSTVNKNASTVGCGTDSATKDVTANDGAVSATFLKDSEDVPSTLSGKVLFYREFTGSKASTICLPFAYTPKTSDGTFYTFDGITKNGTTYEATMTEVTSTSLSPNMPYLFVPAGSNTLKPVLFHGTAAYDASKLTDTKTPWTFIGTYSRLNYGTDPFSDPVYGFAAKAVGDVIAGDFVRADAGAYIPAMRCYLKYNNSASTRGEIEELPERITVKLVNDPTSIGTLNTRTGEVTFDGWYSLDGHRLNSKPTKKGLYIYKGIKVTIK